MPAGLYYGVSICLVSFASGLSVVTLNVYHRGVRGTGVPPIIKTMVLHHLARLVFLHFEPRDKNRAGPGPQPAPAASSAHHNVSMPPTPQPACRTVYNMQPVSSSR